jgi:hypothetical protein
VKYGTSSGTLSNNQQINESGLSPNGNSSNKKSMDLTDLEELLKNDLFLLGYI